METRYKVVCIVSPASLSKGAIQEEIKSLSVEDLLTLKKDIVELINNKLDETNDH